MMDFVLQMMNFMLKMMDLEWRARFDLRAPPGGDQPSLLSAALRKEPRLQSVDA